MIKQQCSNKHIIFLNTKWSGKRDSNPQPLPWQGNALPIELFPHTLDKKYQILMKFYHYDLNCQ